jgi:hypothetical protein
MGRFHRYRKAHLSGPFMFMKALVVPRVRVSAEALPWRPNTGVFVAVYEPGENQDAFDRYMTWRDTIHEPDVLAIPGIAGLWTFATREPIAARSYSKNVQHIAVYFLDGPPLDVMAELARRTKDWQAAGRMFSDSSARKLTLAAPFERVEVGKWDWFEGGK